jgi:hypothetical protein
MNGATVLWATSEQNITEKSGTIGDFEQKSSNFTISFLAWME